MATPETLVASLSSAPLCALARATRSDKGGSRVLRAVEVEALVKLRIAHPSLSVIAVVRQLVSEGVLQKGGFSMPSVYRILHRGGLDRSGPGCRFGPAL